MQKNKQTVVLDLDATLIHTFKDKLEVFESLKICANEYLESRIYMLEFILDEKKNQMWGVVRPHTQHFIEYCFERFDKVIVWSAGIYEYVHHICDILFQDKKPHKILTADDCEKVEGEAKYKPLEWLYKDPNMNSKNTIIVDDNPDAFAKNKDNAVQISSYAVSFSSAESNDDIISKLVDDSDVKLSLLIKWFENEDTKNSEDVRELEKPIFI